MAATSSPTPNTRSPSFLRAVAQFGDQHGYLAAAACGLPTRDCLAAIAADLDRWTVADCDPKRYDGVVARTRAHYARLVGVSADRVAIGSQTSVMMSLFACAAPPGAEVLCVLGDFSSIVFPFLQRRDIRVRCVEVSELAREISDDTWAVSFSLVQSATGILADAAAIRIAAQLHGALTLCDTTQAAGVMPVDAALFDATVCHAYKWLCAPRGVAFLTVSTEIQEMITPVQAGWFAGNDVWDSCYGPEMRLAGDARRFDVSPAWQPWVGGEQSISMFADLDIAEVWAYSSGLGDLLCDALRMPRQHQAIVTWADEGALDLKTLAAAGVRASGRMGRLRCAFHLWNGEADVEAVARALRTAP